MSRESNGHALDTFGSSKAFPEGFKHDEMVGLHRRISVQDAIARHESIEDAESLASIDRPPEAKLPPSKVYRPASFHVLALLAPASIFGVLTRLGLLALTTYDGQSTFPLAYVQSVGCLLMGFGLGLKDPFGRFYGPLYTAFTTGFCGSLTTFSGWQVDVFSSWTNPQQFRRDGLRDAIDGISKTLFTLSLSLASLSLGVHLANSIKDRSTALPAPNRIVRLTMTSVSIAIYAATIPTYFQLSPAFRHQATAALLFSFPGTLTRYVLSLWLNPLNHTIPLGTFTANTLGTALLGAFYTIQRKANPVSPTACALLQGLGDGYCGCLTTVSTFAAEISALGEWKAWLYVAVSWLAGQLLLLLIVEVPFRAGHVQRTVTCSFS